MLNKLSLFEKAVLFGGVGSTLVINPWFQLDPINIPKMVFMVTISAFLAPRVIVSMKKISKLDLLVIMLVIFFLLTLTFAISQSNVSITQQFWGTWGRSTGFATYVAFLTFFLACLFLSNVSFRAKARLVFERVGYVVSGYAVIQWAELDPVNWSQKALVSTLGNINFMSSLVGLASISYVARVFFERCAINTKIFFLSMITVNVLLITSSNSIQGIAIFLAGTVLINTFYLRNRRSFGVSAVFLLSSSALGLLGLLGTASIGPLRFLVQETVIFRTDYWRTAVRMTMENPWSGVGLDSYGDFYRFYRDDAAILRTGPQRVTNTAHNIFLDISSGAGVFALLFLVALFSITIYVILKGLSRNSFDKDSIFWSSLFVGFIVFCLISINQIGVGIWGFIAMGIVIGNARTSEGSKEETLVQKSERINKHNSSLFNSKAKKIAGKSTEFQRFPSLLGGAQLSIALIALVLAGQQAHIDSSLYGAIRNGNLDAAYKISFASVAQDQHRQITFMKLQEAGRQQDALKLAQRAVKLNDRSWQGWVFIVYSDASSNDEKREAALKLLKLDPKNSLVRQELLPVLP